MKSQIENPPIKNRPLFIHAKFSLPLEYMEEEGEVIPQFRRRRWPWRLLWRRYGGRPESKGAFDR